MFQVLICTLVLCGGVLAACDSSSSSPGGSGSGTGTTTDASTTQGAEYATTYKALITTHCAGCHASGGQSPQLSSFEKIKTERLDMIEEIEDGSMPPMPSAQWTNTDKSKLLNYLKASSDFR